jgi:cytochrome P450
VTDVDTLASAKTKEASALLDAARGVFAASRFASVWGLAAACVPPALPLIAALATALPDAPLVHMDASRGVLMDTALALVRRERRGGAGGAGGEGEDERVGGAPPARSSFLATLTRRNAAFSEDELAAQAFTFVLVRGGRWIERGALGRRRHRPDPPSHHPQAGYETTATALAFTVALLARHPTKQAILAAEIDSAGGDAHAAAAGPYLQACFAEALRLFPPAPMTLRVAEADQEVAGCRVPRGTSLQVNTLAIQRDASLWPDAEAFLPERWLEGTPEAAARPDNAYAPFGDGALACVGARFAQREAATTLARLFSRFSFTPADAGGAMEVTCRLTLGPKHGVVVTVAERGGAAAPAPRAPAPPPLCRPAAVAA